MRSAADTRPSCSLASASRCARSRAVARDASAAADSSRSRAAARSSGWFRPSRKPASSSSGSVQPPSASRAACSARRGVSAKVIICHSASSARSAAAREAVPRRSPRESCKVSADAFVIRRPLRKRAAATLARADGWSWRPRPSAWRLRPSGRPRCRFIVCTAAPDAPLPRLSMRAISSTWSALPNTNRSARCVSLQAWTSNEPSASTAGSDSGITLTKGSSA